METMLLCRLSHQDSATMHICPSEIEKSQLRVDLGRDLLAIKFSQGEVPRSHSHRGKHPKLRLVHEWSKLIARRR
jgi:hypothetical protein